MISSTPIFASDDILRTLEYYKAVLGFGATWTWGEPPTFGGASSGGVSIMFNLQPELSKVVAGHQHSIKVDDADAAFVDHVRRGAEIVDPIADRPWGVREYVVKDIHGYLLRFAGPPLSEAEKSDPLPGGVSFVRGRLATEDFLRVTEAAFGQPHPDPAILDHTWVGVSAKSPHAEVIGVLRIVQDAPGWFSIWDVAVLPEWQGKHIGSEMMKEAKAVVQEASPGAFVFLFTYKHGFYERLGFAKETVSMVKV